MRLAVMIILITGLLFSACFAEDPLNQQQKEQRYKESYSLGYEFGSTLKWRGVSGDVDVDVLLAAIKEGIQGANPALSMAEIRETLSQLKKKVLIQQNARFRELASRNLEQSKVFMESNKSKDGVVTLPDGLQYKVIFEGSGPSPKESDIVKVTYRGTLTDGTEFDTSHGPEGPVISRVDGLMKGLAQALPMMKVGSKWQLFVPPSLGYGERQFRRVPPNSVLVYEVQLLSIEGPAAMMPAVKSSASEEKTTTGDEQPNP